MWNELVKPIKYFIIIINIIITFNFIVSFCTTIYNCFIVNDFIQQVQDDSQPNQPIDEMTNASENN